MVGFSARYLTVFLGLVLASPAHADEIYGGFAAHQVVTIIAVDSDADSVDLQAGYRGDRIEALSSASRHPICWLRSIFPATPALLRPD